MLIFRQCLPKMNVIVERSYAVSPRTSSRRCRRHRFRAPLLVASRKSPLGVSTRTVFTACAPKTSSCRPAKTRNLCNVLSCRCHFRRPSFYCLCSSSLHYDTYDTIANLIAFSLRSCRPIRAALQCPLHHSRTLTKSWCASSHACREMPPPPPPTRRGWGS